MVEENAKSLSIAKAFEPRSELVEHLYYSQNASFGGDGLFT